MSTLPNKTSWKPAAIFGAVLLGCGCLTALIVGVTGFAVWRRHRLAERAERAAQQEQGEQQLGRQSEIRKQARPANDRVGELLGAQPFTAVKDPDGIAVAVLIDTSGSMRDKMRDADGSQRRKLDIACRSVVQLVQRAEAAAHEHPQTQLVLGLYEFSVRGNKPRCRPIAPLAKPNVGAAQRALNGLRPEGDTPIGDAMLAARAELAATGCGHQHVLVVTDGENTKGLQPADIVAALARLPDEQRVSTYLIAFDVDASVFDAVEDAGALVLPASGGAQLEQSLDYVWTGKILAEQPLPTSDDSREVR